MGFGTCSVMLLVTMKKKYDWLEFSLWVCVFHPRFLIHCDVNNRNSFTEMSSGASLVWYGCTIKNWNPNGRHPYEIHGKNKTEMLFGMKVSDLLKAWLALWMETRLMTPASHFLLEAPLPLPDPPVWCDVVTPFPIGRYAQHEERSQDVL